MTIAFPLDETRANAAPTPAEPTTDNEHLTTDTLTRPKPLSAKMLYANRANAAKSTGPRTPAGKKTVSQNATTHGLTSATPPPLADPSYSTRLYELKEEHRPQTPSQHYLIEQLAHIAWKLDQFPQIEAHLLQELKSQSLAANVQSEESPIGNSQSAIGNPNPPSSFSLPHLIAQQFLSDKPSPLTRLWDLHRRLTAQFQSLLRQLPKLRKEAAYHHDQDNQALKRQEDIERGEIIDNLCNNLHAHNAKCLADHAAKHNLPPGHPAGPAQNKPTNPPSEISNPEISNPPPSSILNPLSSPPTTPAQNKATESTTPPSNLHPSSSLPTLPHPGGTYP